MTGVSIWLYKRMGSATARYTVDNIISADETFETNKFYELVIKIPIDELERIGAKLYDQLYAPTLYAWYQNNLGLIEYDYFDIVSIEIDDYTATIKAQQIVARLQGTTCEPFSVDCYTLAAALTEYADKANLSAQLGYTFYVRSQVVASVAVPYHPTTLRDAWTVLQEIANTFGVIIEVNTERIDLIASGRESGFTTAIGDDLMHFRWSKHYDKLNNSGYNTVVTYWSKQGVTLYGKFRRRSETVDTTGIPERCKFINVTKYYDEAPSTSQLNNDAESMINLVTMDAQDDITAQIADLWRGLTPAFIAEVKPHFKPGDAITLDISPYEFQGSSTVKQIVTKVVFDPVSWLMKSVNFGNLRRRSTEDAVADLYAQRAIDIQELEDEIVDLDALLQDTNGRVSTIESDYVKSTDLPTVNDGALTIQQNGTSVGTFTANQSGNSTVDLPNYWGIFYGRSGNLDTLSVDATYSGVDYLWMPVLQTEKVELYGTDPDPVAEFDALSGFWNPTSISFGTLALPCTASIDIVNNIGYVNIFIPLPVGCTKLPTSASISFTSWQFFQPIGQTQNGVQMVSDTGTSPGTITIISTSISESGIGFSLRGTKSIPGVSGTFINNRVYSNYGYFTSAELTLSYS